MPLLGVTVDVGFAFSPTFLGTGKILTGSLKDFLLKQNFTYDVNSAGDS